MKPKVLIGIPGYQGQGDLRMPFSLPNAIASGHCNAIFPPLLISTCVVTMSHNLMMSRALRSKADALLVCDTDVVVFPDDPIGDMVRQMLDDGHAIRAAPVPVRDNRGILNVSRSGVVLRCPLDFDSPFVADRVGFACTAFNLAWYRDHWPEHTIWFRDVITRAPDYPDGLHWITDDYEHCSHVGELGGVVSCDPRVRPLHRVGEIWADATTEFPNDTE